MNEENQLRLAEMRAALFRSLDHTTKFKYDDLLYELESVRLMAEAMKNSNDG